MMWNGSGYDYLTLQAADPAAAVPDVLGHARLGPFPAERTKNRHDVARAFPRNQLARVPHLMLFTIVKQKGSAERESLSGTTGRCGWVGDLATWVGSVGVILGLGFAGCQLKII